MKIVFNLKAVGLGNNGGTRTLIKCAETIRELGHETIFLTTSKRHKYTWGEVTIPIVQNVQSCDVMVATGVSSVPYVVKSKAQKKFYYIRGFEKWITTKEKLVQSYRQLNCIVNSTWLKNFLAKKGVHSHVVYPGLDFDQFFTTNTNREDIIGGIFSRKHPTKRHDVVIEIGKRLNKKVLLLNRDSPPNPTNEQLRNFYNQVKVWVSPSELEGLHNCPMEASLCGCAIVGTDHGKGGTEDYCIPNKTAIMYDRSNIQTACDAVSKMLHDNNFRTNSILEMQNLLKTKIQDRKTNMKKMLEIFNG